MHLSSVFEIGFLVGLLGSVHCIGMCGPLVMALPISQKNNFQKITAISLYHFGKITSYAFLGVVFGLFGSQLPLFGLQQNLSIIIGVSMLIYVLYVFVLKSSRIQFGRFNYLNQLIVKGLGYFFKSKSLISFLWFGMLNGVLPCFLFYLALTSALATQNIIEGGLLMAFFGLGTMPALMMVTIGGQFLNFNYRRRIQKLLPVFILGMGLLLILRGLNLGIPYISPIGGIGTEVISCHN